MFTPTIRIAIVLASLLFSINDLQHGLTTRAYLSLCVMGIFIWGYFKSGTVYLAWTKIKQKDFDKAEKILDQTKYPKLLTKEQRGYFHFIKGLIYGNRNDLENSYINLKEALKFGVRTENDLAIINFHLSEIEFENGKVNEAKNFIQIARKLKFKEELEPMIKQMEDKINNASQHYV